MTVQRLRIFLTLVGIALSIIALKLDRPMFTWITIAVLVVALLLRFALPRRQPPDEPPEDP